MAAKNLSVEEENFMEEAFAMAREAVEAKEVPVGCVLVFEGRTVIGRGRNDVNLTKNATRHAEMLAIDQAAAWSKHNSQQTFKNVLSQCALYVTVEPCIMCASALKQLKIPKIVYGASNDRFGGLGSVLNFLNNSPQNADSRDDFPGPSCAKTVEVIAEANSGGKIIENSIWNCEVISGVRKEEAVELLKHFYNTSNPFAPIPNKKRLKKE